MARSEQTGGLEPPAIGAPPPRVLSSRVATLCNPPVLVLLILTAGLGLRRGPGSAEDLGPWPVNQPVAVAVENDTAEFSVPTPTPNSRVLVVVSALGRGRRPYAMRLEATSSNHEEPPRLALDGESATPRETLPPVDPVPPEPFLVPPPMRVFSILFQDGDPASAGNYRPVKAHLRALGRRVQVYVDERDLARVAPETLQDVVSTFDTRVFPTAARMFGVPADVDGDGRFTVLLTGWLDPRTEGRLPVDGFVRASDFDLRIDSPFSNQTDMLYLSASLSAGPYLRTVLAHEYTHAVTFSRKVLDALGAGRPATDEEGWLDEALAHLVEDVHAFSRSNLDYRVNAFLSAPERYRLVVLDYYLANLFRSHGNRGATYSFLRWCADEFGPTLLPNLVRSSKTGIKNLEASTGRTFASLYREWSCSLVLNAFQPNLDSATPDRDGLIIGPRPISVRVDGPADVWTSAPTSSHYVLVEASPTGFARIRVRGAPGSELQVSVIRLPDDRPALSLSATAEKSPDGSDSLSLEVRHQGGKPVHLSALSLEPLLPTARSGPDSPRPSQGQELATSFDRINLDSDHPVASARIPVPESLIRDGSPVVIKLLGLDPQGLRIPAWAEIIPATRPPESNQP